ncbi:MAG: molybdopterin converting factor subunit 1 [Gammaproteobacteria bacterium]|jgi:molybdopterin synthase sulfur carrier subunit|nr:molybdopterin converting factor subunit 1 [Gammaproteobacteria bacterium]
MSIKVKFFARMRDEAGLDGGELEYEEGMKIADIWNQLVKGADYPEAVMVAVNMEYVSGEPKIKDGDEIAFFPPVTGG